MVGTLLERPAIDKNFQGKYAVLIGMCNKELDEVKRLFDLQMARAKTPNGPVVNKNMPPVAGVLRWCQELRERTQLSLEKLKKVEHGYASCVCLSLP